MRKLPILLSLNMCLTMLACGADKSLHSINSPPPQELSSTNTQLDKDIDATLFAYEIIFKEIESYIAKSKHTLEEYEEYQKGLLDVRADSLIIMARLSETIKKGSNHNTDKSLSRYEMAIRYNEKAALFLDKGLLPKPNR